MGARRFSYNCGRWVLTAVVASALGVSKNAHAGLIYDSQTVDFNPAGSDSNNIPLPTGTLLYDSGPKSFIGMNGSNAVFWGSIESQVYSSPTGDVFVYQVTNNNNSTDDLEHVTLSSFSGYTTDADYNETTPPDSPFAPPLDATRAAVSRGDGPPSVAGATIAFDYVQPSMPEVGIAPGQTTDYMIVETDSSSFTIGNGAIIDGAVGDAVVNVPSGAIVAVPEPASLTIIAAGGGMIMARRRRAR